MQTSVNGFRMAYDARGSGKPILFIHGFPLNRRMWDPQLEFFSGSRYVIAPDLRGHGDSEAVPGPYEMDLLAGDCNALLEALGVSVPVVICGLSMGGYITLAFYRKYPERTAGLVLAATRAGADTEEGKANREKAAADVREKGITAIIDGMLPKIMAPGTYERQPALVERVRGVMAETSVEGAASAQLGMKARPDSNPRLPEIRVPVLVVHGTDDQIIPPGEAEKMHAAIPNSRLEILPETGHLLNLERPDLFNRVLASFLASLP